MTYFICISIVLVLIQINLNDQFKKIERKIDALSKPQPQQTEE